MVDTALTLLLFCATFGLVLRLWWGIRHWAVGAIAVTFGLIIGAASIAAHEGIELVTTHLLNWQHTGGTSLLRSKLVLAMGLVSSGALVVVLNALWPNATASDQRNDG